jgi:hypothetical protein
MRGIGRVLAGILLAGAVAGAAAFAHGLGGAPDSAPFGIDALPPAPSSPLVVEASARPPAIEGPVSPLQRLTVRVARVPSAPPAVAHARPIVIAAIPHPSAHPDTPLPVSPTPRLSVKPTTPPVPTPATPAPVVPAPPPAPTPPVVRVVAAVTPVAAPVVQDRRRPREHGRGHDTGKHDRGNDGKGNEDQGESSAALVLAVPAAPTSTPPVEIPPAVSIDPSSTDTVPSLDGWGAGGRDHGHDHWHGHDHGQGGGDSD